jgi:flagellar FliL protein
MNRVMSILNIATRVMMFIVTFAIAAISLTTAYIMFAPDEFPKPFRLVYSYDGTASPKNAGTSEISAPEATPTIEPTKTPDAPGTGMMFNMSTKIINLADPAGRKYIRLTVVVEFAPDNPEYGKMTAEEKKTYEAAFQTKINNRMPVMDDVVITLLSTKTFDTLYTAEGKEKLRSEVKDAIQAKMAEFKLLGVYFTEFVVQ